ncbi:MAG TPA: cupin domain-containing protein [Verrucomicrobiota bacterium]|nr:cupin domain-containing protein [Verrucomicrobiota bacterium]HNT15067.1 cupin domain-containing protein [Verrucomicrobiota bacterium]
MSDLFGATRTVIKARCALLASDSAMARSLPGWKAAACVVSISPALLGPRFTQLQITLKRDGVGEGNTGPNQYFIYVLDGAGTIDLAQKRHRLEPGSFVYLPPGSDLQLKNSQAASLQLLVFQKRYLALRGVAAPEPLLSHEREIRGEPDRRNEAVTMQRLLPEAPAFDLAIHRVTYAPGALIPAVECHGTERGLALICGQGICRLAEEFYPVQTGDAIWLGAGCPYWFAPLGRVPATWIGCHEAHRDPM